MTYQDFLNIDEKILIRDKKLFDHINEQIKIHESILYDPDGDNHDGVISSAKIDAYSDIYFKLLQLTKQQFKRINQEPTNENR